MNTAHRHGSAEAPEAVVQRQLDAYNARDLQAWLATYAPDAQQHLLHGEPMALGREAIHARMVERFNDPALHARLLHRTVIEQVVVDHERVTGTGPNGLIELEVVCIYEVSGSHIAKATFALGVAKAV